MLRNLQDVNKKIIFSAKQSLEEFKIKSTQLQENLKICNFENENINTLVLLIQYQETKSSLKNTGISRPSFGLNQTSSTTSEMLNAIKGEYKSMEGQFSLAKKEIKNAKGFVKTNLTAIIPSVICGLELI